MSLVQRNAVSVELEPRTRSRRGLGLQVRAIHRLLSHLECGAMTIVLPDGDSVEFGAPVPGPHATLVLHRWRTVWRTLTRGDMGFAEAFIDGDCSSPDIAQVVELFVRNEAMLDRIAGWKSVRLLNRIFHLRRANTRAGSKRNIVAHYDLGNTFFERWLDDGMTYSSALYANAGLSLEAAQTAKQDRILDDLALTPGSNVLEIGCGWGALAARILERGCHVTGVTLSPSQLAYAEKRLAGRGDADDRDLRLQDYRDVTGINLL